MANGLKGHKQVTDGLLGMIRAGEVKMLTDIQRTAKLAAAAGEDAARDKIDNTPSSLRPGKMHRNWTFLMNQSLNSDAERRGNTITARAGWIHQQEGYFLLQEYGTTKGDITITPMRALQAAHEAMLKYLAENGLKQT